ncbi:MAG: hypothetical protein GF409_00570 [Candidatus Omnitrophica bacterium]|nr:hypothetical protein [Candidatus Omnitrophota bacterium]
MADILKPQNIDQHPLKPLSGSYVPSVWLFVDTETRPHVSGDVTAHFFQMGWSCLWIRPKGKKRGTQDWVFHSSAEVFNQYLDRILSRLGNVMLLGHNIFFDLQACGFYSYFSRSGWSLQFYYDKGLTYILRCEKKGNVVTVLSTTNWFDQSLEKLGQQLRFRKLKVDFDTATWDELKVYCRRDVEIILKAMQYYIRFIESHGLGRFSLTKSSQAFTAFRSRFMSRKIYLHRESHINDLERSAYLGGRTECFQLGQIDRGPFVSLDVNSMYPYVMKAFKYPYQLVSYFENIDPSRLENWLKTYALIAEVEVNSNDAAYAVRYKGKTIFPVGQFTCFLTTTGIRHALRHGHLVRVLRVSVYRQAAIFEDYVDYFHDLRLKYKRSGNKIMLLLCKYMHNSLYGKFGQLKMVSEIEDLPTGDLYEREDIFNMVTGHMVTVTRFMNREIIQYPEGEGEHSAVSIAAHITENARFTLWDIIRQIGTRRVLYCDTDSVKIRTRDLDRLTWPVHPSDLGALKVEDRSKSLYIQGPKNYRTETMRKIKGIPKRAEEIEPGAFRFNTFVRQVGHMRTGQIEGVKMQTVTRRLKTPYTKGVVLPSGRVRPFRFPGELPPF